MKPFRTVFSRIINQHALIFLVFLGSSNVVSASWDIYDVVGSQECGECHEEEYDIWKSSKHQKTFKTFSRNKDAKKISKKLGIKRIKNTKSLCSKCHYTIGNKRKKPKIISGVSCESCHTPAKKWINVHNDYGGKGVKKEQESVKHKKQRFAEIDKLGLIRSKHLYDWAYNCFQCHIIDEEELVNVGGHPTGEKFNLLKRSQEEIRHSPKATAEKQELINLVGNAMTLQFSLRALSHSKTNGKYKNTLITRFNNALKILSQADNAKLTNIISLAKKVDFKSNANELESLADQLSNETIKLSGSKNVIKNPSISPVITKKKTKSQKKDSTTQETSDKDEKKINKISSIAESKKEVKKAVKKENPTAVVNEKKQKPEVKIESNIKKQNIQRPNVNPVKSHVKSRDLILGVNVITPSHYPLCTTYTPWLLGKNNIKGQHRFTKQECFALELSLVEKGNINVFFQLDNQIMQIYPNSCKKYDLQQNLLEKGNIHFPLFETRKSVFLLSEFNKLKGVFTILTKDQNVQSELIRKTKDLTTICQKRQNSLYTAEKFKNVIEKMKIKGGLDWHQSRVRMHK